MPLPWKKKKSDGVGTGGRISRFVADFQSPAKRGGSLVVETGFPTSLIDLFHKNRERIKKSTNRSKREKQQKHQQQQGPIVEIKEAPTASLPDDPQVPTRTAPAADEEVDRASSHRSLTSGEEQEDEDGGDSEIVDPSGDLPDRVPDRISSLFLMMPAVVILGLLAMFTKWLVIGATVAAFLPCFAEFVLSAPVVDSLKPGVNARASSKGLIRNVESPRRPKHQIKRDSPSNCDPVESVSSGSELGNGEIEVSEPKLVVVAEPQVEDCFNPNAEADFIVDEDIGNQRNKLRSKIMKKIVPKRIRNQKKVEEETKKTTSLRHLGMKE